MSDEEQGFLVPPGFWQETQRRQRELAEQLLGGARNTPGDDDQLLIPRKHAAYIEVSNDLLMDMGVIPDTREHKPIPWRTRLRWRITDKRFALAGLAYRLIARQDLPGDDG